jgi:DNA-binding CsgD family transcriptional regulator
MTERDYEAVVQRVRAGSNKGAAAAMGISVGVVRAHMVRVYRVLEVDSFTAAVVKLWRTDAEFRRLVGDVSQWRRA